MAIRKGTKMRRILIIIVLGASTNIFGQYKTEEEFRKNSDIERNLIIKNHIERIEALGYSRDYNTHKWTLSEKMVYYFDLKGMLVKTIYIHIDREGNEKEYWSGGYVYNSSGLCDSVPTDKGSKIKAISRLSMYPTCYKHLGHKKLKDGLAVKVNEMKLVYSFKYR